MSKNIERMTVIFERIARTNLLRFRNREIPSDRKKFKPIMRPKALQPKCVSLGTKLASYLQSIQFNSRSNMSVVHLRQLERNEFCFFENFASKSTSATEIWDHSF